MIMNSKYLTLAVLLCSCMGMSAQSMKEISSEDILLYYGGQQTFAISPNGRYVCGATFAWSGFIYDAVENKNTIFTEDTGSSFIDNSTQLLDVNDSGVAVGFDDNGGIVVDAEGNYRLIEPQDSENDLMALPHALNEDASVIVGSVTDSSWSQQACIWKDGVRIMLPQISEEEAGFRINGCCATDISADGRVILGYVIDRLSTYPMVVWTLQSDGSYALNPIFLDQFESNNVAIRDEDGFIIGYERGDRPFLIFTPCALSPDGKTVVMQVVENNDDIQMSYKAAFYDVASGDIEVIDNKGGVIDDYGYFEIAGLSDNKVAVGYAGLMGEYMSPFVLYGETGRDLTLSQAFPGIKTLAEYEERMGLGYPWLASGISANGQYITGYGVIVANDNLAAMAFIIDTENGAVIGSVVDETREKSIVGYYSIDGTCIDRMQKGINVIRYSDGSSRKILKK